MDESGIDMGFDLASFLTNDNHVDHILDEMTAAQHQDFMYYELKSKAVPVTESFGMTSFSLAGKVPIQIALELIEVWTCNVLKEDGDDEEEYGVCNVYR
ncbi:unnamed protein product [Parnassius mnemosyne]|uniref:Uncharacterized protein n=1 Tax=Parnassius mnemosyne TaxID=213953 RepID=A0AAV1LNB6_9NEOP